MTAKVITLAFAVMLVVVRTIIAATVEPEAFSWAQVYKDVAHLFMGGLFVSW